VEEVSSSVLPRVQMMMNNISLQLKNAGKKFNREWIFKGINYHFQSGNTYAVVGPNGSGKSTLLQCIAASMNLNEGAIEMLVNMEQSTSIVPPEKTYNQIAICAPYLELVEEMTTKEFLQFHQSFKPLLVNISIKEIIEIIGLTKAEHKQIRYFSSGMKQRLKLAQAIFSNCALLLLDEPCTNLDKEGYALYEMLLQNYCYNKLVIICSNEEKEISFCKERIAILDYK
jgi:ABC-type multidrug transport system ATPase subunit